MNTRKLVAKSSLLSLGRFFTRGLAVFFSLWAARILGPLEFGRFLFITSFVYLFIPVADLGMESYLMREIPRRTRKRVKILRRLFYPRLIASLIAYLLCVLSALSFGYELLDVADIAAFGLMLLPYSLSYFFQAYFNAQQKTLRSLAIKLSYPLIYIFASVIFLLSGGGYRHIYWSITLSLFFSMAILLKHYPQVWQPIRLSVRKFGRVVKKTWPFAVLTILAVAYLRVDVAILKKMEGELITGYYGPATNLVQLAILIPQSIAIVLFPISSRLVLKDRDQMGRVYFKVISVLFLISIPVAIVGIALSDWGIDWLMGIEYAPGAPALKIAFLSLVLFFVNAFPGNVIQNSKKIKKFIPWAASNLAVNIVLNLILIPRFSLLGAAWAKVGSEFYGLVINNWFVWRILKK